MESMNNSEDKLSGAERFLKWMHARVGYEKLPMKTYMDGDGILFAINVVNPVVPPHKALPKKRDKSYP